MGNEVNLFIRTTEEVRLKEENKILRMKVERLTIELNREKERRKRKRTREKSQKRANLVMKGSTLNE